MSRSCSSGRPRRYIYLYIYTIYREILCPVRAVLDGQEDGGVHGEHSGAAREAPPTAPPPSGYPTGSSRASLRRPGAGKANKTPKLASSRRTSAQMGDRPHR
jgi:hypothetical protein